MTQSNRMGYAALAIAGIALALSIGTAIRGPGAAAGGADCTDRAARAELEQLRRALVERDAVVARLARGASGPAAVAAGAGPGKQPPPPADPAPRRYSQFETGNPAVSVTQSADGSYDIRTTDPALVGTTLQVTAVSASGEEEKVFIRIPPQQ